MKRNVLQRWRDPQFVAEIGPLVRALLLGRGLPANTDLRGIVVGLDGAWPELLHTGFAGANLAEIDASYGSFSCSFAQAKVTKCRFDEAVFDTCRFQKADFTECSFIQANLDSPSLDDAIFRQCRFEDARITGRRIKEYGGRRVSFINCIFKNAVIQNVQFRATTFQNCTFEVTQFRKCFMAGVKFQGGVPITEAFQNCEVQSVQVDGKALSM
jgi:uncharacterized protein YjbI with pentapeptide repeats